MTWAEVKAAWSTGWKALQREAMTRYGAAIRADPEAFRDPVRQFTHELTEARRSLDAIAVHLDAVPADPATRAHVDGLEQRYADLAAGLFAGARLAPDVGVAPAVVLVIGGVVLGVAAIAWAVAAFVYAANLREQTALAERELAARVEASREGRILPPSTLPAPPAPASPGAPWALAGGAALVLGAAVLPSLWRR